MRRQVSPRASLPGRRRIPNASTQAALKNAKRGRGRRSSTVEDLFVDLEDAGRAEHDSAR
jgi:hypothetical protein